MMNLISGISVWAAYGVLSAAGVILCSRMKEMEKNKHNPENSHFSVEPAAGCVYNKEKH